MSKKERFQAKIKSLTSSPTIFSLECIFFSTFSKDIFDNKTQNLATNSDIENNLQKE